MKLHFDTPAHGWMNIQLNKFDLCVSDVPCDSLLMLIGALARILSGSRNEVVEWSLEPEYAKWIFNREGEEVELLLKTNSKAKPVSIYTEHYVILVDNILTAFNNLAKDPCWIEDADELIIWSWSFPSTELQRLNEQRAKLVVTKLSK